RRARGRAQGHRRASTGQTQPASPPHLDRPDGGRARELRLDAVHRAAARVGLVGDQLALLAGHRPGRGGAGVPDPPPPPPLGRARRGGEALSAALPFGAAALMVVAIAGLRQYWPWPGHVEARQAPYLNVPFFYIRTLAGQALLWWLTRDLVRTSLRSDAHLLK